MTLHSSTFKPMPCSYCNGTMHGWLMPGNRQYEIHQDGLQQAELKEAQRGKKHKMDESFLPAGKKMARENR